MSIETDAQQEAERRWPVEEKRTMAWASRRIGFEAGAAWAREQDTREPSDAEVEAAARGAYDRAFLKHAPEDVDRWDDLVVDNDEAAESWREVARAALLAAREVRRG